MLEIQAEGCGPPPRAVSDVALFGSFTYANCLCIFFQFVIVRPAFSNKSSLFLSAPVVNTLQGSGSLPWCVGDPKYSFSCDFLKNYVQCASWETLTTNLIRYCIFVIFC